MENVLSVFKKTLEWMDGGKQAATATVVSKSGSGMREISAKMGVSSAMEIVGSVSGGCVESAVVQEALEAIKSGEIRIVDFGISDETAWSVGLTCGGKISVLIQPITNEPAKFSQRKLEDGIALIERRELFSLVTVLDGKFRGYLTILSGKKFDKLAGENAWWSEELGREVSGMQQREESGILALDDTNFFVDTVPPQPRLVIIGGAHVSIPLVNIAKTAGYYTLVIDPRRAFANRDRFSEAGEILVDWPREALEKIRLSKNDFLLILSHDDKIDLPALEEGLSRGVRYIGMLSSKNTRDDRYKKLEKSGFTKENFAAIHAPVGLDIGAKTPEEIALAVLAEITAFRYGKIDS